MTTNSTSAATLTILAVMAVGCGGGGGHAPTSTFAASADAYRTITAGSNTARADHTATRIPGTTGVLIAGGETLLAKATRSAEVFDASSGVSRELAGGLTTARAGHFAVALDDGRILIGGGHDEADRPLDTLELYDPARDRFELLSTRLQRPRDRAAVARIGSRLYVACGRSEDTLEQLSLSDFSSRTVAALPGGPRQGAQLVALDQTLLLYGGGDDRPAVWCDLDADTQRVAENDEIAREGTVVRWPQVSPEGLLVVGGLFGNRDARGYQVVTPDDEAGDRPTFTDLGLFHSRNRPALLVRSDAMLVFGGTLNGLPVASGERQAVARSELLPSSSGARGDAVAVAVDQAVVLVGGRGADGRPTALIDLVLPPGAPVPNGLAAFEAAAQAVADREALEQSIAVTGLERDAARAQLNGLQGQLQAAQADLAAAEARSRDLAAQLQQSQAATAAAQARAQTLTAEVAAAQQRLTVARQNAAASQAERARLQTELDQARAALATAQQAAAASQARAAQLEAQVRSAQQQVDAQRAVVASLR